MGIGQINGRTVESINGTDEWGLEIHFTDGSKLIIEIKEDNFEYGLDVTLCEQGFKFKLI